MKRLYCIVGAISVFFLSGCQEQEKLLYSWGNYQSELYEYMNDNPVDYDRSIENMNKQIESAKATNLMLPPGFFAHLGLLNLEKGRGDNFVTYLNEEKRLYPESSRYIDFLLKSKGK